MSGPVVWSGSGDGLQASRGETDVLGMFEKAKKGLTAWQSLF